MLSLFHGRRDRGDPGGVATGHDFVAELTTPQLAPVFGKSVKPTSA
jgi:hypothetical protein